MKMPFDFRGKTLGNRKGNRDREFERENSYWEDIEDGTYGSEYYEGDEEPYESEYYAEEEEYSSEYNEESEEQYESEYYEEGTEQYESEYYEEGAEQYHTEYVEEAYQEEYSEESYGEEFDPEAYVAGIIQEDDAQMQQEYYREYPEEYYADEEEEAVEYYEEDEDPVYERKAAAFPFAKIMDYMVMFGGVAIVLVALILGGSYFISSRSHNDENVLLQVGSQLNGIDMIGQQGLSAMSSAQKELLALSQPVATPEPDESAPPQYEEDEYEIEVDVRLSLTSIEKDLKIKFLNRDTGKLVGNVPFAVEVTDEDGDTEFWSDDDMDGIIYKKKLKAGEYSVKVQALEEDKYKSYGIPSRASSATVKSKINYEKVDIAAEIKSESQVDVSKEDTKKNDAIEKEYLNDTVVWVESTVTGESYEEVGKDYIPNPLTLVRIGSFARLAAGAPGAEVPETQTTEEPVAEVPTEAPTEQPATEVPTQAPTEVPTEQPATEAPTEQPATEAPTEQPATEAPSATPTASTSPVPSATPTVSASPAPSATPTASTSPAPSTTPIASATPTPSATPIPMELVLKNKTAEIYTNEPYTLEVELKNAAEDAVLKAESSNTDIAKAEVKDSKVIITGTTVGEVTITVKCEAKGMETKSATCTVVVKRNPKEDKTSVLKDNQGRELYVLESTGYRQAYYADYYTASNFYIRKEAKYTGWQTIEGKVKYFDAAGKYVVGEQIIQGVKYNFASDGSLVTGTGTMGIDVSKWNGTIDWNAVRNSGVSYVIIRCGYRGSSKGNLIQDSKFKENIKGATNAGLKVGVYFFSQAIDKSEAIEEASMVLECIKGYTISYPVFLDVEPSGGRADSLDKATRTEICKTFCETIKQYGYTPGIYANKNWMEKKIDMSALNNYKIWLAQYASEPTYQGRYDMWQYKDTGKINGVKGNVDLNMSYLGY